MERDEVSCHEYVRIALALSEEVVVRKAARRMEEEAAGEESCKRESPK